MESTTLKRHAYDIFKKDHKVFIEGHRGVNRECYENTMNSFRQSVQYGLDSIELDVWLTKDKIPIIIHGGEDGFLFQQVADIDEKIKASDLIYEELMKYNLKSKGKEKVPKLSEVLDLCKGKMFINIEMKDPNINETFAEVIKLLEEKDMINQIAISSFRHEYHNLVEQYNQSHNHKLEFGYLYDSKADAKTFVPYNYNNSGSSMNIYQKDVTKEIVDKAHRNNIRVLVWFLMDDEENDDVYRKLFDDGIDVLCCNEPKKAKDFVDTVYYKHIKF